MDVARYRAFITAVETGSLTAAAERMHYSPSGVSQLITALERELGVPLLRRNSRSVVLTPAGEVLLDRAEALLREADALAEAVRSAAEAV